MTRVFIGDRQVKESELKNYEVRSKGVDRIINNSFSAGKREDKKKGA